MMNWGLLLTPEDLLIPPNPIERTRAGSSRRIHQTEYPQCRACFTLARRDELWRPGARTDRHGNPSSHSELFGAFAIGLTPLQARRLGAVPVIYHYEDDIEVNVTREVLMRLRDLRNLALVHAYLEAKAGVDGRDTRSVNELKDDGYDLVGEPEIEEAITSRTSAEARLVAKFFDTDRVPAWNLVDVIDTILHFFQTTDAKDAVGSLAYFQQREWRIGRLHGPHVRCYPLGPKRASNDTDDGSAMPAKERNELREALKKIDHQQFSPARLDRRAILMSSDDKPFFDHVAEMIIPLKAANLVYNMLASAHLHERFVFAEEGGVGVFIRRATT
jgi:hypothetical protein